MLAELLTYVFYFELVFFSAIVRSLLGIYHAYNTYPNFKLEKRRVGVEIVASTFFGSFALLLLSRLNIFTYGLDVIAMVAGLFGADAIKLITKKFGLTKGLEVTISRQQMQYADLNDRQMRALDYVKQHRTITNKVYANMNQTDHIVARRELRSMVKSGRFKMIGSTKNIRYVKTEENGLDHNRTLIGPSKSTVRKIYQKQSNRKHATLYSRFRQNRRSLRSWQRATRNYPVQKEPNRVQLRSS